MGLKHQLEVAKIRQDKKEFIPLGAVPRIINEETLEAYFRNNGRQLHSADLHKILSEARRLFATLVLLDRGCDILEFLSKGCGDKDLPFLQSSVIPEIDSPQYRSQLYRMQWQIPTILQPVEHKNFPIGFISPFTYEDPRLKARGSFGYVCKVLVADGHLAGYSTEKPLALKEIMVRPDRNANTMMREVQTLQARRHDHIVPLIASWTERVLDTEDYEILYLNILFPWARMNLGQWLDLDRPPRDWEGQDPRRLKEYIYHSILSISGAVVFVHSEIGGLISSHHDIKPANILLFEQTWKLADFGRTHLLRSAQVSDTEGTLGTYTYQPPEYLDGSGKKAERPHGRAFDVWSLGCINIEFLTIAVYGWEGQQLRHFRERREENLDRPKRTPSHHQGEDHSFLNNMIVVRDWTQQLLRDDGNSSDLRSMLKIVDTMIDEEESHRCLSWEVYLDLYEFLHPNATVEERETKAQAIVQPPSAHHGKREHNPLQRAVEQENKPRVKGLLKKGWAGHPVDLLKIDPGDPSEIIVWIRTATAVRALKWRRLVRRKKHQLSSLAGMSHDRRTSLAVEEALRSSRSSTASTEELVHGDERVMTRLHRKCEASDYWAVMRCLERTSQNGKAVLLTHADSTGRLPLHYAARKASPNMIKLLLENFRPLKPTALAAFPDHAGRTPLHEASQYGNISAIKCLLRAHMNPMNYSSMEDNEHKTAQDLAHDNGHMEVSKLLEETRFPAMRLR